MKDNLPPGVTQTIIDRMSGLEEYPISYEEPPCSGCGKPQEDHLLLRRFSRKGDDFEIYVCPGEDQ